MSFSVRFVGLPKSIWFSWPEDRSLAMLANDSIVLEKLIRQTIDFHNNQFKYSQICERIQVLAMRQLGEGSDHDYLLFEAEEADMYLSWADTVEGFERDDALQDRRLDNINPAPIVDELVRRCFLQPDESIDRQGEYADKVSADDFSDKVIASLFQRKYAFYQKIRQKGDAIVEVITL